MTRSFLKRAPAVAFAGLCLLLAGCDDSKTDSSAVFIGNNQGGPWVAIEPTQCLTNSWEQDWLVQNDGDYARYPKDHATPGLEPAEFAIIVDYYARQGVEVFAGATAPKYEAVCLACSCPEGHTMFLQVRASDVETMIALGYRVEAPPSGSLLDRILD